MVGLFETVWRRDQVGHLNVFAVTALFTGLIQLSAEMRVANPILAANAIRRFDTALEVMRALAEYWLNADVILRLFEESSERLRNELRLGRAAATGDSTRSHASQCEDPRMHASQIEHARSNHPDKTDFWHGTQTSPDQQSLLLPDLSAINVDAIDWNSLYWENPALLHSDPIGALV